MAPRVVSLVPSVTETLRALGAVPVACTRFCEEPDVTTVGGTKTPDVDAIVALAPDVVVMNDEENRREDFDALRAAGLRVLIVSPRTVADVGPAVAHLAEVAGSDLPAPFAEWEDWLEARRDGAPERTALTMVWRRPWVALGCDTYGASLLDSIGIATPLAHERYPEITLDDVGALAPGLVLLPSEPYPFTEGHADAVRAAAPDADVRLVDGRDLFWWGIRTPVALTRMAGQLG